MKKSIGTVLIALILISSSYAQNGKQKRDWDPEKRAEKSVAKFNEVYPLEEVKAAEMTDLLTKMFTELKSLEGEETAIKAEKRKIREGYNEKLRTILGDEGYLKYEEFKKEQREAYREKRNQRMQRQQNK